MKYKKVVHKVKKIVVYSQSIAFTISSSSNNKFVNINVTLFNDILNGEFFFYIYRKCQNGEWYSKN